MKHCFIDQYFVYKINLKFDNLILKLNCTTGVCGNYHYFENYQKEKKIMIHFFLFGSDFSK